DPVDKAAAELRKLEVSDDLKAKQLTATLRGLRQQAEARAKLENPKATPEELAEKTKAKAEDYYNRLRTQYNFLMVTGGGGMNLDQLIEDKGDAGDTAVNKALMSNAGKLSDVEEIVLALSGDRKDTETVERILKYKSADEIKFLKTQYMMRT